MSYILSISERDNDMWMLKNSLFCQFSALLASRFDDDKDVVKQIEMSEAIGGLSLDCLYLAEPELALRVKKAMQTVAREIAGGLVSLSPGICPNESVREAFFALDSLLERFPQNAPV